MRDYHIEARFTNRTCTAAVVPARNRAAALQAFIAKRGGDTSRFDPTTITITASGRPYRGVTARASVLPEMHTAARVEKTGNVRKYLDVSTGNLTESTRNLLSEGYAPTSTYPLEYGWLIYVTDDPEAFPLEGPSEEEPPPADLVAVMDYARNAGCFYLLIDADAPAVPGLPYYADGKTAHADED